MNGAWREWRAPARLAVALGPGGGWLSLGRWTRHRLFSGAAKTLATNALLLAVSTISAIFLARGLGPDGRAAFEAINFLPRLLTPIVQLGLSEANAYFVSGGKWNIQHLVANTPVVALGIGIPVALLCLPLLPLWLHYYDATALRLAALFVFTVPLGILNGGLMGIIRGQQRFTAFNVVRVIAPITEMLLLGGLFLTGRLTLFSVAMVHLFGAGFLVLLTQLILLGGRTLFTARPHLSTLRSAMHYGIRCQTASVTDAANSSADRALLVTLLPPAEFGQFIVATRLPALLLHLPSAVGTVLMPESARRTGPDALRLTQRALVVNAVATAGLAAVLLLAMPVAIPVLFGPEFRPAVLPAQVMLVGIGAYGLAGIVGQGLSGMGRPLYNAVANGVGALVTLAGILLLEPVAGLAGVAAGSAAGYVAGLGVLLFFMRRLRIALASADAGAAGAAGAVQTASPVPAVPSPGAGGRDEAGD